MPVNPTLSVREFENELDSSLRQLATQLGLNFSAEADRGKVFQHWCAELIFKAEPDYESPVEDVALYSNDLGADLVIPDENNRQLLICQCKYRRLHQPVDETAVNDFFHRHLHYMNRRWVADHGTAYSASALNDYPDYVSSGWNIEYRYLTTGRASERVQELVDACAREYRDQQISLSCELLDFSGLKDYYIRSRSLEASIPERVQIDLRQGLFFATDEPYPTIIAMVKANTLRNLFRQYKHSLYAYNIRGYLGNHGINKDIGQTARSRPDDFFYLNNGVSAVCTNFDLSDNHLTADRFQIINGAQTVTALAHQDDDDHVDVLFRLTTTPDVATDRGLNQDIIRYNNTQNAIKISDFRSNDPLQQFLERELQQNRVRGPLPPFYYIRKRGAARRGTGFGVRLEDFAKMRYSYLYEPTLVHAAPKQLWTIDGDEGAGAYPKAFGIDGVIHDIWTTPQVDEGRLVIALHQHFVTEAKAAAQRDEGLRFLHRARFHSLALAGAYARELRDPLPDISSLAHSRPAFQSFVDEFALAARMTLIFAVQHYLDNGTLFAFVRSTEQWTSLLRDFKLQLHAQS